MDQLPTYEILNKQYPDIIVSDMCLRCSLMKESIDHVWWCEDNEITINDIIKNNSMILKTKKIKR